MTARPPSSRMKKLGPVLVGVAGVVVVVVDASVNTGILL
jgi:hypothetical protein